MDYYQDKAKELFRRYQSLIPEELHCNWAHLIRDHDRALDIGCGSGRDVFFLCCEGTAPTGVDPCRTLLDMAADRYQAYDLRWIEDGLPELPRIRALKESFDLILCNAVWMHLRPDQRQPAVNTVRDLLDEKGRFIVNLRYGPSDPAQGLLPVDATELRDHCRAAGLKEIRLDLPRSDDRLRREGVTWETLAFER